MNDESYGDGYSNYPNMIIKQYTHESIYFNEMHYAFILLRYT